jgi:hypothetical protein
MNPIELNQLITDQAPEKRETVSSILAQEKNQARERLLTMPPIEAQKLVEPTIYPQYWEYFLNEDVWEESLPSCYGETDF